MFPKKVSIALHCVNYFLLQTGCGAEWKSIETVSGSWLKGGWPWPVETLNNIVGKFVQGFNSVDLE